MTQLIELGAVGEIAGWAYDRQGVLIQCVTNSRVAGVPLEQPAQRLIIGIAGGLKKSGVNFGGSAWEVDRTIGRRRSCRPSYS